MDAPAAAACLPASFPSRSFPLRFNATPALPLLPGYCQALPGLGGVVVCPAVKGGGARKMSLLFSLPVSRLDGTYSQGFIGTREDISLSLGLKGTT